MIITYQLLKETNLKAFIEDIKKEYINDPWFLSIKGKVEKEKKYIVLKTKKELTTNNLVSLGSILGIKEAKLLVIPTK